MTLPPPKPWSRRQWIVYWLFVIAVNVVGFALVAAIEINDRRTAGLVVLATTLITITWFVIWLVRTARRT